MIEHQKVERRQRVKRRLDASGRRSGLLETSKRLRYPQAPIPSERRVTWPIEKSPRTRTITKAGGVRSRVRTGWTDTGSAVRSILSSVAVPRRMAIRVVVEERDVPLLLAAVVFAVVANMMLLTAGSDRILLSGSVASIQLPAQTELMTTSSLAPVRNEYAVIGEVAGVDPAQFARLEVSEYTVQSGDTLGEIASEYDLTMDTLISFNQIEDVRRLQVGDTFQIPNRDGLLYTVKGGDSLDSIAREHDTTVNELLDANDLRSQTVEVGQVVFVPGARLNATERGIILGELFAWPAEGVFSSGFGMRSDPFTGLPRFHNGIDLAGPIGSPIRAAASGRVVHVESQIGNYGRFVIVRHPDGFQTLYAHLQDFGVRNGQSVSRGQRLGTMGNTGRSTGPHLHFSVIHNGRFVNPLRYLH
ncbi:MAG: peptidoglycan DD-metalloendopeptidase family protein [Alkalispirochaeta sp.]